MDKIATSTAEAYSQLQWLRKERGFEGHNQANPTLVSFLDNALNMFGIALFTEAESVLTVL
jgi:hypothetical protein